MSRSILEQEQKRTQVRRARRYPRAVHVELTDLESETHLEERTTDLSLFGCCVATCSLRFSSGFLGLSRAEKREEVHPTSIALPAASASSIARDEVMPLLPSPAGQSL